MIRRPLLAVVLTLASFGLGACAPSVAYVPVREARFRSERVTNQSLSLPLSKADREWLIAFLRAGGDKDRIGTDAVAPDADSRYRQLLALLSDEDYLSLGCITDDGTYSAWFGRSLVRQVIDAREDSPPAIDPVAVTDGTYWWIFRVQHRRLSSLLVEKDIRVERPK